MSRSPAGLAFFVRSLILCVVAALCFDACENGGGGTDSNTNWLRSCATSNDCGGLSCVCGVCTTPCADDSSCGAFNGATCRPVATGSVECGSVTESTCALACGSSGACPRADLSCVAGLCVPASVRERGDASLGQGGAPSVPREAGSDGPVGSNGGAIGQGGTSSGGRSGAGNDEAGPLAGGGASPGTGGVTGGSATICNDDGICEAAEAQTGKCADCTPGFTIISPPPVGPGVTTTIGQGGANTTFAADRRSVYFDGLGLLYAFDLDASHTTQIAAGVGNLVTMSVTSTDVVFTTSSAVAYELGRVAKTGGTVQDLGVTAQAPVLVDDAGLVFLGGNGMVKTTLATLPAVTPLPNLDPTGFAWGLTTADVFELVRSGGTATELLRVNRATGQTETPALAPLACATCPGAIATSGTHAIVEYGADLLLWNDGDDGPTTLDQASGPLATDGVSAYYASGGFIWKRSLAVDGGAPSTFANETPLAMWVTDTYVVWTVANGPSLELRARVK